MMFFSEDTASFGMRPGGHVVRIEPDGLSYKKVMGRVNGKSDSAWPEQSRPLEAPAATEIRMREIDSAPALYVCDADSRDIVDEINAKYGKFPLWPMAVVAGVLLSPVVPTRYLIALIPLMVFLLELIDRRRRTTTIVYDIDPSIGEKIRSFYDTFDELMRAEKAWHVAAAGEVGEKQRKYHAGADHVVERSPIRIRYAVPKYIKTNVKVPCVPVGRQTLYFFPDRVLLVERRKVGAVSYRNLTLACANTRFVEEGAVPRDTRVVGHTWRYVNKNGGPDKRFKDNRQLPICLYSELWFRSGTGLNEMIQVSKPDAGVRLTEFLSGGQISYAAERA